MKRYLRILMLCVAVILLGAFVLGCGGTASTDTEPMTGETGGTEETDGGKHEHASTGEPLEVVASTCSQKGYKQYRCDECNARYVEELPLGKHEYITQYDVTLGYEVVKCNGCDDWRMEIDGNETREFAAVCSGDIALTFDVIGSAAEISFTVDGKEVSTSTYEAGEHTVSIAKDLSRGGHTFGFAIKNGGCALDLTDISTDGTLHRKDGVILEMTKTTTAHGGKYNDFFVYIQTSDPSGDYYIRYRFLHSYSTAVEGKTDSSNNNNTFRIVGAELVKVSSVTETAVKYTKLNSLLTGGEVAVAIKEPETVDYIGGYHGEEHILEFWMYADNEEYTPGDEAKVVVCSYLEFNQLTEINRCNTPADKVITHEQYYRISTNGIQCKRTLEWLMTGFEYSSAYLQMFTMLRKDGTTPICNIVETFDENGNSLGTETVDYAIEKDIWVLKNTKNRTVKYSSATSGISAEVGFTILENSVQPDSVHVSLRKDSIGDNKWYASFKSPSGSKISTAGDIWALETFYHIDYVNPEN